jgi:LysR family transcriptional regulator for metE and metH
LGEEGVWPTLYAAVRTGDEDSAFVKGFLETAIATCFKNLIGIVPVIDD